MKSALQAKAKTPSSLLSTVAPVRSGLLQRKCACGGTPGPSGECESCRKKRASETLQRSADHASEVPPIVDEVLRSPGHQFGRRAVHSSAPAIELKPRASPRRGAFAKGSTDEVMSVPSSGGEASKLSESTGREQTPSQAAIVASSVAEDGRPSTELKPRDWGFTWPEAVDETVAAAKSGMKWHGELTQLHGHYSKQTRLLPGVQEVTGPAGNTNAENFCSQAIDLATHGDDRHGTWYMLAAVVAHEDFHATRMLPALKQAAPYIQDDFERVTVPDEPGKTAEGALAELTTQPRYAKARARMLTNWRDEAVSLAEQDHDPGGPTEKAEDSVVNPMITTICEQSRKEKWPPCTDVCEP